MTSIEWTDETWNPTVGCSRVSEGCRNCYAERQAYRNAEMGHSRYMGITKRVGKEIRWTGVVRLVPEVLDKQLGAEPIDSALRDIVCNGTVHYVRPAADTMCHEASVRPGYSVVPHDVGRLLRDCKGGDMSEFPEDLRVREFPS